MTIKFMFTAGKVENTSSLARDSKPSDCYVESEFRYMLFTVYYSIIFILGFVMNIYILYIFIHIYAAKKLNEIKIFIVNLTISDLLFLVTLPMWIVYYHQRGNWIMPKFLCNVAGYLFSVNTYCSVAFLGVITYNRFQTFTKSISNVHYSTRRWATYITVGVWVLIAVPAMYYFVGEGTIQEKVKGQVFLRCFERYDPQSDNTPIFAIHVVICICFFGTFFVVLYNIYIIVSLLSVTPKDENSALMRRRELWLMYTILAVFIICYVPHHIVDLPWTLVDLNISKQMSCQTKNLLNSIHQVTFCLMGANCVLHPIVYCFLTKHFWKYFLQNMKFISDSRKGSSQTTATVTGQEEMVPLELYVPASKS